MSVVDVAPNVTSILVGSFHSIRRSGRSQSLTSTTTQSRENPPSVERQSTWQWRSGCRVKITLQSRSICRINPLQSLVSRASKTLAVEVPLHYSINGVGAYAGSCDGVMLVNGDVVLIDYKTKRHGKYVHQKYCERNVCSLLPTRLQSVISTKTSSHQQ